MRLMKLAILGLAIFGGVTLVERARGRLAQRRASELGVDDEDVTDADLVVVAVESGIAELDPEGLETMGEGIDREANEAAHDELRDLHDRLPRH